MKTLVNVLRWTVAMWAAVSVGVLWCVVGVASGTDPAPPAVPAVVIDFGACGAFNPASLTTTVPYWDQADKCGACVATSGCGFCHSTMQCLPGTTAGPSVEVPCPDWLFASADACPQNPHCDRLVDCTSCAVADSCAWCASKSLCLTVEDTYTAACRGTVFDLPCPTTYVADNQGTPLLLYHFDTRLITTLVVGNLAVVADPVFGGGGLVVQGPRPYDNDSYRTSVDAAGVSVDSAGPIDLRAGNGTTMNVAGGAVNIQAGSGTNINRGKGGSVSISAGDAYGLKLQGGSAVGGDVAVSAGQSKEGVGGNIKLTGGSSSVTGGSIFLVSGGSTTARSGTITLSTAAAPILSGPVVFTTGKASSSGTLSISSGDASIAGAVSMQPGASTAVGAAGAKISVVGSTAATATGGTVKVLSGTSSLTSSGDVTVLTAGAPVQSGNVLVGTGTAAKGVSGSVYVATGSTSDASKMPAGDIVFVVGQDSGALQSGSVIATGGATKGGAAGGIQLSGGDILGPSIDITSHGGVIEIRGGSSKTSVPTSQGGDIRLSGGSALAGAGGDIALTSGRSEASNSGDVMVNTAVAQTDSGTIDITTGAATFGQSGDLSLNTGNALQGRAGVVQIQSGMSQGGAGSDISLKSGASASMAGGNIVLESGQSGTATSGEIKVGSADS
ncbi:hypothetical protein DYB28_011993, partial [Aphanomyces astaci]